MISLNPIELTQLRKRIDQARRQQLIRAGVLDRNGQINSRPAHSEYPTLRYCETCGKATVGTGRYCKRHSAIRERR